MVAAGAGIQATGDHSHSETELLRRWYLTWKLLGYWGILFPLQCIGFVLLANLRHSFPLKETLSLRVALPGEWLHGLIVMKIHPSPSPPRGRSKFDLTFLGCFLNAAQWVCSFKRGF